MRYRTAMDCLEEGGGYHKQALNETQITRDERRELYRKARFLYNFVLENVEDTTWEAKAALGAVGSLFIETGEWGVGITLLKAACRADPEEPSVWNALGAGYRKINKVEWARGAFEHAIKIMPPGDEHKGQLAQIMHNMATTYINEGEPQKAVDWSLKALAIDPDKDEHKFNLGLAYLELGDFAKGWDGYEVGRRQSAWDARNYSHPGRTVVDWDGSPGKNLVVYGEQGVGDEILFAHALKDAIAISKSVIIDCHPRLVNLFKRSFPECVVYGTRKDDDITWPGDHEIDAKVPFGSLHRFFRRDGAHFPIFPDGYIKPDGAYVREFAGKSGALRVGLSWIGGTKSTHVALRSMQLEKLAPILSVPGVEFVSLQYTEKAGEEVERVRAAHGWNITHDDAMNADLDKLFGCIAGLDLVVTVLTSNVHFAGAMNVPTWVLTPVKAPWQFMQKTMPWYPKTKLYRQDKSDDWQPVINTLARDLGYAVEAKRVLG